MAAAPLFLASVVRVKQKLRLTTMPTAAGAADILDEAILSVRVNFIRELGPARVIVLQALAFTENPTTADETLRAVANVTEVNWIKLKLLKSLPMRFADGNSDERQSYFEEGLFRNMNAEEQDALRLCLQSEISEALDLLSGRETIGNEVAGLRVVDIAPDIAPPLPGDTVYKNRWLPNQFTQPVDIDWDV